MHIMKNMELRNRVERFYSFCLLCALRYILHKNTLHTAVCMSVNALYKANLYILIFRFKMYYFALHLTHSELKYK